MIDIRSVTLSDRERKNVGNTDARKQELKDKLRLAVEYLRDDSPIDKFLREAIAGLIEDFAFPKRGPKGSSIDILEFGYRVDELREEGKKAGEIDRLLSIEFKVGDENDQSTAKRKRLSWEKYQEFNSAMLDEWNADKSL